MGNDGGSIPGRKDLVKERGKEKRLENNELVKQSQSKYCALTKEPLKKPVIADRLGLLYNKEALIQALIEKRLPKSYMHISSLKDLKDLNINFSEDEKIQCPVTRMEFSGLNSFYIIWKCGCVLSKKALEELHVKDKCVNCGEEINVKRDLISLNYSAKEKEEIFKRILEEKLKMKEKKNKMIKISEDKVDVENKGILLNKKREKDTHSEINNEQKVIQNETHTKIQNDPQNKQKVDETDAYFHKFSNKKSRLEN